ncbi:FSH1 [[Candida] subhashii]|uniref:FSH1 n=1 Tax=[Candida] subhashii TaxID=561895 RepID=A0A8J5QFH2_9ASCO|nr:FSH1 [[Candida] subhashii]KAG7661243.1 FSH1 [[Candida] subhashii]
MTAVKKILCLPGFLQNGSTLAAKSSGLRKSMTKKLQLQLDFIDPYHRIQSKEEVSFPFGPTEAESQRVWESVVQKGNNCCWWDHQGPGNNVGLQDSVDYIIDHIRNNGPYEGIIGFSQGAAMALMITNSIRRLLPSHPDFKIAMFISCFCLTEPKRGSDWDNRDINYKIGDLEEFKKVVEISNDALEYTLPPNDLSTKIIVVYGENDNIVTPVRSKYAASVYSRENVSTFPHDGAHLVPNKKDFIEPILKAFNEQLYEKSLL